MRAGPRAALRDELVGAGMLVPTGVPGLYGRTLQFEAIVSAFDRFASERIGGDDEVVRFPPVMPRSVFEQTDYLRSFPHLMGTVNSFFGDDRDHAALLRRAEDGKDWSAALAPTDVVLAPAVCHPIYPTCAGRLPTGGRRFDLAGWCFRHEPSEDPARLQSFRMHEWARVGDGAEVSAARDDWVDASAALLGDLQLEVETVFATDPFFGRGGRILATSQREAHLKVEIVAPVGDGEPVAVASCNDHLDHFGVAFGIDTAEGAVAHSACVGFGLERVALALLARHGPDTRRWPPRVVEALWPR